MVKMKCICQSLKQVGLCGFYSINDTDNRMTHNFLQVEKQPHLHNICSNRESLQALM